MSSEIRSNEVLPEVELNLPERVKGLIPVIAPIALAIFFIVIRAKFGQQGFLYEGALTMLALICYTTAAVLLFTNLFVKESLLDKLGLINVALGYSFGLSGW